MSRLRHSPEKVALAMKMRTEGNGLRATARILGKSHATIIGWEKHLAEMEKKWSPAAPNDGDGTLEGDEEGSKIKGVFLVRLQSPKS
ncbi:MAG: helix-turn-helix domain-containing protein [Xenococcaceae cyanobacterium MO_167.B27]|nr:helix-turn-helix domain-containing protein [Xenococcaceae cyanobacterium MO_167.B27]